MRYTLKGYFVEPETGGKSWRIVADKVFVRGRVISFTPVMEKIKNHHVAVRLAGELQRDRKTFELRIG